MNLQVTNLQPFGVMVEPAQPQAEISSIEIKSLKELFHSESLVLLRGFRSFSNKDQFVDFCESWGEISLWPFGKVLELIEQETPEDHIFDNNYVPLHWDGMYRPQVPETQIFHCVSSPKQDQGGKTTFSHTAKLLENASSSERELWSKVTGVYERKMEFYHSKTIAPVVTKHPFKDYSVVRYCEPPKVGDDTFLNHPNFEFQGLESGEVEQFQSSLEKALYAKENFYAHQWQTGDVVISDNHTLLHGRDSFTRHLRRVHVIGDNKLDNPHLVFHS